MLTIKGYGAAWFLTGSGMLFRENDIITVINGNPFIRPYALVA